VLQLRAISADCTRIGAGQVGVDVDVIVIDDASTDGSAAVVRDLAASDDRICAILHPRNRGHIATYNEGLEQARGEYVVLLSADDALPAGALAPVPLTHPGVHSQIRLHPKMR
jgi:glycosyltransferase involved in cell wall biosynthesis